jgi:hypothetical protein
MSRKVLALVAVSLFAIAALGACSRYLYSLAKWTANRELPFEDGSIRMPVSWVGGKNGYLFSALHPAITLFTEPAVSQVTINNFAEHWLNSDLGKISADWLRSSGRPISGAILEGKAEVPSTVSCATDLLSRPPKFGYVRIYCLSKDSVHSYEFFGSQRDVPAFFDIVSQASQIAARHPARVFRR